MNLLELAASIGVVGFLHCDELQKLVELAANRDVLEVGSFKGLSAWGMAITAKSITCVDTFRANSAGQQQMPEQTTLADFRAAVSRYANVHTIPVSSEEAAALREMQGRMFDMIFLDAMHDFQSVKDDIARWMPHLRSGGILAFHDYRHPDFEGVARAVDEVLGTISDENICHTLAWIIKP